MVKQSSSNYTNLLIACLHWCCFQICLVLWFSNDLGLKEIVAPGSGEPQPAHEVGDSVLQRKHGAGEGKDMVRDFRMLNHAEIPKPPKPYTMTCVISIFVSMFEDIL